MKENIRLKFCHFQFLVAQIEREYVIPIEGLKAKLFTYYTGIYSAAVGVQHWFKTFIGILTSIDLLILIFVKYEWYFRHCEFPKKKSKL